MSGRLLKRVFAFFLCLVLFTSSASASVTIHFSEDKNVTVRKGEKGENFSPSGEESVQSDRKTEDQTEADPEYPSSLTDAVDEDQTESEILYMGIETEPDTENAYEETEADIYMPAQKFSAKTESVSVVINAPEGAFPEGTSMSVWDVEDQETLSTIEEAVSAHVSRIHAVDITFSNKEGRKIEPLVPVSVIMAAEEKKEDEEALVIHVNDEGKAEEIASYEIRPEEVEKAAATEIEIADEAAEGRSLENNSNREQETAQDIGADQNIAANSEVEAETKVQNVSLKSKRKTKGILASAPAVIGKEESVPGAGESVQFTADHFSVYALVYTVDFHYEVNGKTYEFSIPGGGFVSLAHLLEAIDINNLETTNENSGADTFEEEGDMSDSDLSEDATEATEEVWDEQENTADREGFALNSVEVSEETWSFLADVVSVEFSDPELIWITKVNAETTVGELKETNKLVCQYSAELTKEQINEINAQTVEAGDWALISMFPFTSEETLTITMSDGKQYLVKVTDYQICDNILTADGITFYITVTYDDTADIPVGTRLVVEEIEQGSEEFLECVVKTWVEVNKVYFEEQELLKKGVDPDCIKHADLVNIDQARFFHVTLMYEGQEIEPKTPVQVDIKYVDGLGVEGIEQRIPGVSHFTNDNVEVINEVTTETNEEGRVVEFGYTQDSFSDIGVFIGHETHDRFLAAAAGVPDVNLGSSNAPTIEEFTVENGAPEASKALSDNGDGTYTLALHVKPKSSEYVATTTKKSNVLFIMDRSSSMVTNPINPSYVRYTSDADAVAAVKNGATVYGKVNDEYVPMNYIELLEGFGYWANASVPYYNTGNGLYYYYSDGTRLSQEQAALSKLIQQLIAKNEGEGNSDNIEISIMSFSTFAGDEQLYRYNYVGGTSTGAWVSNGNYYSWGNTEVGWTNGTNASTLINAINDNSMARGTNWEEALVKAKAIMKKKVQDEVAAGHDDEDYYVVFLTDGAPTATTWSKDQREPTYEWGAYYGNGVQHPDGSPAYSNNEGLPYAYNDAKDDALDLVTAGYKLYNIFTYGSGSDVDYMRRLTNFAYSNGEDDTATITQAVNDYFTDASDTSKLVEAFNKIFKDISGNIGHSQVKIKDGLTVGAMTSTFLDGKPSAVRYTVTPGQGSAMLPYTVQASMPAEGTEPVVTFNINGQIFTTTSGAVQKKVNPEYIENPENPEHPEEAYDAGEYYSVTVNDVEYKMALASVDKNGELTWDLTPMGILWDNCDYKAEFVVWPNQEAYNYVAGLNNEMPGFVWTQPTDPQYKHTDSKGRMYWSHGVEDYPSIVKYEDGTFAVLTNTHQELEYSVTKVEDGEVVDKAGPFEEHLNWPDPMPLNATKTNLTKQWNVDRNPAILAQYLFEPDGTPTEFVAKFDLYSDNDEELGKSPFATVSLGWDSDLKEYVWVESSLRRVVYNGHVLYIGTRWSDEINIATGLMVTYDRMQALGLNPAEYPKATYNGTTYYILERGHDYHVKENNSGNDLGYEFDFESPVFHPMLVNGQMVNVIFEEEMNEETLSLTNPYPITEMIPAPMNSIGSLVVDNTLRGYINVEKVVVGKDGRTIKDDDTTKFSYDVVLTNGMDPGPFTEAGSNIPWYGINDLFYHAEVNGKIYYFQAEPQGGSALTLTTEDGDTYTAEASGAFDPDSTGPTTVSYTDGNGNLVTLELYGNQMKHDEGNDNLVYDTIQITHGQTLNIANVPKGTEYTITESILDPNYDLMSIVWRIKDGDTTISSGRVNDISSGSITRTIVSNRDNRIIFTNKIHSADVIVKKVDNTNKTLLGAKFTLTKIDGETPETMKTLPEAGTADTGAYTFADLSDGVYKLTEIPPANYTGIDPITFVVTGGKVYMPGNNLPEGYTLPENITWPEALPAGVTWTGSTFTLTVPNTPIPPQEHEIRVEKRWEDEDGNPAEGTRDVKVQLRRYKADTHDVTVVFHSNGWSGGAEINDSTKHQSISGDQVTIEFDKPKNFAQDVAPPTSSTSGTVQGPTSIGNKWRIVVTGVNSDITVTINYTGYNWQLVNQNNNPRIQDTVTVDGNGQGSGDYVADESFPATADLEKATKTLMAPDYYASWTFGQGNSYDFPADGYQYYIVELDENDQPLEEGQGGLVSITNNDGITTGIITATNKINGSLLLKKQLSVLQDEEVSHAAGKYNFTVTGPGESGTTKHVQIRINAAGTVTYKVSDTLIAFDESEGFVSAPSDGTLLIPDLAAGTYTVTEGEYQLDDQTGKYTMSLGQIEVESGTADLSTGSATLNVRAENTPSAVATFTNMLVPMVDVPVEKNWQWSENDAGKVTSWTATFNLEYREVLVSGEEASDAKHSWTPMYESDSTTQKSVTLRSTDSVQERFADLPLYKTHANGSVYRLIYAVDEVSYTITFNDGRTPATETWSKSESGHLTDHYSPDYEQDAGEGDMPEAGLADWYTIRLTNVRSTKEIEKTIDLSLEKVWEDEALQNDPNSWATFQLKRTYHEEYLDYNKNNLNPTNQVTVTLNLGSDATKELVVPRGAPVYVTAVVKPGETTNLTFNMGDSTIALIGGSSTSTGQQFVTTENPFAADDVTVSFVSGNTSVLAGGLDGIGLASFDKGDTTEEGEDAAFENQPAGQQFTLNAAHGWSKEWAGLPQLVQELSETNSGTRMKTVVYSYYLEEIDCYPKNYAVSFRNGQGDEENPLISSGSVVAENKLETTELSGTKTWNIGTDASYVLGTPILKLSRRTETTTEGEGGNSVTTYSEPEVVTVNWEGTEQFLQPTWQSGGGLTRSFKYTELPARDKDGNAYVYSVEEVEFTVGAGENAVVYTAVRQPDGTYVVTPDKEGAKSFVVLQTDNDIINKPAVSLKLKKIVTINSVDPMNEAVAAYKYMADGDYFYRITGKADSPTDGFMKDICIHVADAGTVKTAHYITVTGDPSSNGFEYTLNVTYAIGDALTADENGFFTLEGLIPGEYTITEADHDDMVCVAVNCSDEEAVISIPERYATVDVNAADEASHGVKQVSFTNNHVESGVDIPHIDVSKTFKGVSAAKVEQLKAQGFKINISVNKTGSDATPETFVLTGNADQPTGIKWTTSHNSSGDIVWTWDIAIPGLTNDATVTIEEINYGLAGCSHSATINGTAGTSLANSQVNADVVVKNFHVDEIIERNNVKAFSVWDHETAAKIFMARLTTNEALVISDRKLDLSERKKVEAALKTMSEAGDWTFGKPVLYYSFEDARNNKISVRGYYVTYSDTNGGQIKFDKTMQWTHTGTATITYQPGRPSDFNFVNEYKIDVDIVKVDMNNRAQKLGGAEFVLTQLDESTTLGHIHSLKNTETGVLVRDEHKTTEETTGKLTFTGLDNGYYVIQEANPPSGYVLTEDVSFFIKVKKGEVSYLSATENTPITEWPSISLPTTDSNALIQVTPARQDNPDTPDDNEEMNILFTVGNTLGVALPSTGGPGTNLLYLFGSMLIMLAGAGFILLGRKKRIE